MVWVRALRPLIPFVQVSELVRRQCVAQNREPVHVEEVHARASIGAAGGARVKHGQRVGLQRRGGGLGRRALSGDTHVRAERTEPTRRRRSAVLAGPSVRQLFDQSPQHTVREQALQ